jgi:O-antigen ligase
MSRSTTREVSPLWGLALVLLVAAVAWGRGGYDARATLVLELGAAGVLLGVVAARLWIREPGGEQLVRNRRAWKGLSFWMRHPDLAAVVGVVTLGRLPKGRSRTDVEILLPGAAGDSAVELDPGREHFVLGHRFKRSGIIVPVALLSLWVMLSLVPVNRGVLEALSPRAAGFRSEAEALAGVRAAESLAAPLSLAPFPTLAGLWVWLAVLAVFSIAFVASRSPRGASLLALSLLFLGGASGALGVAGWAESLAMTFGKVNQVVRASGSFGNPNHYAAFQSMLFLVGLGWLLSDRETRRASRGSPEEAWNERALSLMAGLAILMLLLGLLLSLSRAGIACAVAGTLVFVLLTAGRKGLPGGRADSRRTLWLVLLGLAVFAIWIGIEPLVGRFADLGEQWEREGTRIQVWRDALPAIADFWVTGSGLSSFRYVGSIYRSFGGTIFYSWAHNDYLQLGVELGVPGLVLLAWLALSILRSARRARAGLARDRGLSFLHAGLVSAVVAIALHSASDFSLHLPANLALLAVLLGGALGMEPSSK